MCIFPESHREKGVHVGVSKIMTSAQKVRPGWMYQETKKDNRNESKGKMNRRNEIRSQEKTHHSAKETPKRKAKARATMTTTRALRMAA